jgi:hypothetical protein
MRTKVLRAEDVQFTITPIEYSPEKPARKPYAKKSDSDSKYSDSKPYAKKEESSSEAEAVVE